MGQQLPSTDEVDQWPQQTLNIPTWKSFGPQLFGLLGLVSCRTQASSPLMNPKLPDSSWHLAPKRQFQAHFLSL